jgi:hypothetical protein
MQWMPLTAAILGLAVLPAEAQTSGVILGEGPGKLVDALIGIGYGSDNLYQALVDIALDTNPGVSGVLTPTFLLTLKACGPATPVKANLLSGYAGGGVLINADCTAMATGLQGSGFNGLAGTSTQFTAISGLSTPAAVISLSPAYTFAGGYSVFGILYAPQGSSQSFVLSNEAPGQLIGKLIAAGYGSENLYDTLISISADTDPSISNGPLPDAFINTLATCPASAAIFTTHLQDVAGTIAISDDCTVQSSSLQGSAFNGKPGTTTKATMVSGVGPALAVYASPLTTWTKSVTVGSGTATVTYNAFTILYTPGSAPVPTLRVWGVVLLAGMLGLLGYLYLRKLELRCL